MKVRFANEGVWMNLVSFDETKFEEDRTIGEVTYGYYDGSYIAIQRESEN